MAEELQFRELLLKVQDCLSKEDRVRLHFLFADVLPRQLRDDPSISGTLNLLESLMNLGKISQEDFGYLIAAFEKIGRYDVAQRLRSHAENAHPQVNGDSVLLKRMLDDCDDDHISSINLSKIKSSNQNTPAKIFSTKKLVGFILLLIGILIIYIIIKLAQKPKEKPSPSASYFAQYPYTRRNDAVLVGYFTAWSIYERKYFVENIPANKLTHINYAFAGIDVDGTIMRIDSSADTGISFLGDKLDQPVKGNFNQLFKLKQKHPNIKILITIGGYENSYNFSNIAHDSKLRSIFVASCIKFVIEYNFDGIDISWEYPIKGGAPNTIHRLEDKENYALLVKELRQQLNQIQGDKYYLLTIRGRSDHCMECFNFPDMLPHLDWINVLTLDFTGHWQSVTDHHSALYRNRLIPEDRYEAKSNCDAVIQEYIVAGVPSEKLVMGIPLYARGWEGVRNIGNNGYRQQTSLTKMNKTWDDASTFDYNYVKKNFLPKMTRYFDKEASVPYLFDSSTGIWISYDDTQSVERKIQYINDRRLRGAFLYDLSCDHEEELIDVVYNGLIRKFK